MFSYGDDSDTATVNFGVLPVLKRSVASIKDRCKSQWEAEAYAIL